MGQLDVWAVVPASRPEMVEHVQENFYSQEYENKRLLVVENGAALGAYSNAAVDVVLQSGPHQSVARNTALAWLRENAPGAYVVLMDDDDYYSPHYIGEHVALAKPGRINGKSLGWVMFDNGLAFFGHNWTEGEPSKSFNGGTMGFFVADAQSFPEIPIAEERGFCDAARESGLETRLMSARHYCYSREGGPSAHAYKPCDEKLWRRAGTGIRVAGGWRDWIETSDPPGEPGYYLGTPWNSI